LSLLTICQNAADEIGIGRPNTVYGNTDRTSRRLLRAANRAGKALARLPWPVLRKEATFTSVATETQTSAVPSAWARFVDRTFWNRTLVRPLAGPYSPQEWQRIKARSTAGLTDNFTYRGTDILIWPVPTAGHTMAFEYYSKNWCSSSDGVTLRAAWGADADIGVLSEDLIELGVIWRMKKASAMDSWQDDYDEYVSEVRTALGAAAPATNMDFADDGVPMAPGVYIPETIPTS
jgi:hypothetical protein